MLDMMGNLLLLMEMGGDGETFSIFDASGYQRCNCLVQNSTMIARPRGDDVDSGGVCDVLSSEYIGSKNRIFQEWSSWFHAPWWRFRTNSYVER